jgi:hypothetical protein
MDLRMVIDIGFMKMENMNYIDMYTELKTDGLFRKRGDLMDLDVV